MLSSPLTAHYLSKKNSSNHVKNEINQLNEKFEDFEEESKKNILIDDINERQRKNNP